MEEMNNVLFEEETIVEEAVQQVSSGHGKKLVGGLAALAIIGAGVYLVKKFRNKDEDDGVIVGNCREVEEDEQEQSDK